MKMTRTLRPLLLAAVSTLAASICGAQQTNAPPPEPSNPGFLSSWVSDRHELSEGDIVTILVDEHLLASAQADESASQVRDRDLGFSTGTSGTNIRARNDVANRSRGEASRSQRISGEISARVLEVSPSGLARIEGTKKVQIDKVEE